MPGEITEEYAELHLAQSPLLQLFVTLILKAMRGKRGIRVLDVGCSQGLNAMHRFRAVQNRHIPVRQMIGIDQDASSIERAHEIANITGLPFPYKFQIEDARTLVSIDDESIDLVTMERVMQHIAGDGLGQTLRAIHRVLAPGGVVVAGGDPLWTKIGFGVKPPWTSVYLSGYKGVIPNCDLTVSDLHVRFMEAGFGAVEVVQYGQQPLTIPWNNLRALLRSDSIFAKLIAEGTLTQGDADEWFAAMEQAERDSTLRVTIPFCMTVAKKKG